MFEWRVYDVCAAMRQQSERRRQLRLAKPRKQSHHFADAWQAWARCRALPFRKILIVIWGELSSETLRFPAHADAEPSCFLLACPSIVAEATSFERVH